MQNSCYRYRFVSFNKHTKTHTDSSEWTTVEAEDERNDGNIGGVGDDAMTNKISHFDL